MKSLDKIKKAPWLAAIALGLGLACASSGFATDATAKAKSCPLKNKATATVPAVTKDAKKKAPSFLFVVSADKAKITHLKDGQYSLVIQKSDMNRVIEFSDRPYRIVRYITGSELQKIWGEGKIMLIEVDPPNAVLSASNLKPVIIVVDGMIVYKDKVTFYFSSTHAPSIGQLNKLSLMLDSDLLCYGAPAVPPCPCTGSLNEWVAVEC